MMTLEESIFSGGFLFPNAKRLVDGQKIEILIAYIYKGGAWEKGFTMGSKHLKRGEKL